MTVDIGFIPPPLEAVSKLRFLAQAIRAVAQKNALMS